MTGSLTVPREVDEYLAAVRDALADLPAAERDDLLVEVEASLADAAAESGGALAARLGEPAAFAAELRSAAGLHEAPRPERPPSAAGQRALALVARFLGDPRVAAVVSMARPPVGRGFARSTARVGLPQRGGPGER